MRPIGYSTGAVALSDFRGALDLLLRADVNAVELSALRYSELLPLVESIESLDLTRYRYVSVHAPSSIPQGSEQTVVDLIARAVPPDWPVIVHPDAITDFDLWRELGSRLCIENMDKRKAIGRTAKELSQLFQQLPQATLCFDIGHARQVDPTMCAAAIILREHGHRIRQVHLSEVDTQSRHHRISLAASIAFRKILRHIPEDIALILEAIVSPGEINLELRTVRELFESSDARQYLLTD